MEQKKIKMFVLPGYGETRRTRGYSEVIKIFKDKDIEVFFVPIDWKDGKTIFEYKQEVKFFINKNSNKDDNISALGFSFGSFILSQIAKKIFFKSLYFCSISPYFKDSIKYIPREAKNYFGRRFIRSVSRYLFPNNIKSNAYFFIGGNDMPIAIQKTKEYFDKWIGNKKLKIIPKVEHDISDKKYIEEIKSV
jgi:esterase/lipase